jgi:hypothetical protein
MRVCRAEGALSAHLRKVVFPVHGEVGERGMYAIVDGSIAAVVVKWIDGFEVGRK